MDWVDRFADAVATPFPDKQPVYWHHGLIRHLDLPDNWPSNWDNVELQEKAFVFFLESFDPPENLQGLAHQLTALRHVLLKLADKTRLNSNDRNQLSSSLDLFIEQVEDFISISSKDEQKTLEARQLSDIKMLGLWRFHYHCSQVKRSEINQALNLANDVLEGSKQAKIISVSRIEYLRDGPLDPYYYAIAADLHLWLRYKQRNKRNAQSKESPETIVNEDSETEQIEKKQHDIYNEVIACEHCIHLAHYLLKESDLGKGLKDALIQTINTLSDSKSMKTFVSDLPDSIATAVNKISAHIKSVNNLITTIGGYTKRNRSSKENNITRVGTHSGRLLPPGVYEEVISVKDVTQSIEIDYPLNVINGIFDEACDEGVFHRRYGQRPKVSDALGESEDDYKSSETVDIPASWLVDPYRNAIKQRVQMESLITNQEPPVWSSLCLRIETIQQYLQSLKSEPGDVQLLASLAFYTGLLDKTMESMRLRIPPLFELVDNSLELEADDFANLDEEVKSSKWIDIYLDVTRMEYAYLLPKDSISYYSEQSPGFTRNCETASRLVKVPLPEVLRQLLERYVEGLHESSNIPGDRLDPSSYAKVFNRWQKTKHGWEDLMMDVGRRCHENVTPARIRATFRALFVGQAGLAPLHANLIMNEIPTRYRAQHFYSNINGALLKQQYHDACRSIQETLKIDTKPQSEMSSVTPNPVTQVARFGSRVVPTSNALSGYFRKVHALFINGVASSTWHPNTCNSMVLFIFRLLQLSTGMRPVRDRLPQWPDISFQTRTVFLSDKDSPWFNESRIIPMATALYHWLGLFSQLQKRYFIATNFHLKNVLAPHKNQPTGSMFSYLDTEHKIIRPLSFDDIYRIEEENDLSSAFPFKPNALRHNLLTRLNENKVDQHIIDFIMGHKHFGNEAFGGFSPISTHQYARLATKALDEFIIQPLEIPLPPAYA